MRRWSTRKSALDYRDDPRHSHHYFSPWDLKERSLHLRACVGRRGSCSDSGTAHDGRKKKLFRRKVLSLFPGKTPTSVESAGLWLFPVTNVQ